MGKLKNRIPGSRLLISSLPGSALRTHVESLGKPRDVNMRSRLVNLISKETHQVFSIYIRTISENQEKYKFPTHNGSNNKQRTNKSSFAA